MRTLYLDTRDLINLSTGRDDRSRDCLATLTASRKLVVLLSFAHILEAWKYGDRAASMQLAQYADTLSPRWILDRGYLFREEIRTAYCATAGLPCGFEPTVASPLEVFGSSRATESLGFAGLLQRLNEDANLREILSAMTSLHREYAPWTQWTREEAPRDLPGRAPWLASIARRSLKTYSLSDVALERLVAQLSPATCPSVFLYLAVKDQINRDKAFAPQQSEMLDLVHLTALPYVDAFSTDKRMVDLVRRTRFRRARGEGGHNAFKSLQTALAGLLDGDA